ncbi:hypothetical protein D9M71_708310 [compost metagenome]
MVGVADLDTVGAPAGGHQRRFFFLVFGAGPSDVTGLSQRTSTDHHTAAPQDPGNGAFLLGATGHNVGAHRGHEARKWRALDAVLDDVYRRTDERNDQV